MLESLFTIIIISLLFAVTTPLIINHVSTWQKQQFLYMLDSDVQLMQNLSMGSQIAPRMYLQNDHYMMSNINGNSQPIRRNYPESFKVSTTNTQIRFNFSGQLINPNSIYMTYRNKSFQAVLPFGKGRLYVRE